MPVQSRNSIFIIGIYNFFIQMYDKCLVSILELVIWNTGEPENMATCSMVSDLLASPKSMSKTYFQKKTKCWSEMCFLGKHLSCESSSLTHEIICPYRFDMGAQNGSVAKYARHSPRVHISIPNIQMTVHKSVWLLPGNQMWCRHTCKSCTYS